MEIPDTVPVKIVYIKDSYYEKFATKDAHIKLNHASDEQGRHDRPHLLLKLNMNSNIFVCVPFTTKVEKARMYVAKKANDAAKMHLARPSNYGAAFLTFNGKQNAALVNQVIPVTQEYIRNSINASISKENYNRIVAYVKDNLSYYQMREQKGHGWHGVITEFNAIRRALEIEQLQRSVLRKPVNTPEIQMLKENHKEQDEADERTIDKHRDMDEPKPARDTFSYRMVQSMDSLKAEIGDIRSQLNLESESHDDWER